MSDLAENTKEKTGFLMGNEAIARGAVEAGVKVAAGYPGTPSSEIIENLKNLEEEKELYIEWSVNEKVALEVAAAGSFAGLRSLCVMKQPGLNVAADFLLHLSGSGTRAGMALISADDPGALSSVNEGDSRYYAKLMEIPLLEPGDFQEAKDITKWAFELSEELRNVVMIRTVTRLSHASGMVVSGETDEVNSMAEFKFSGFILDQMEGVVMSTPVTYKHGEQHRKLDRAIELFESSPFNRYLGPENPELLIVTSSACFLYCTEAVENLSLTNKVGILKIGTSWPLPPEYVSGHMKKCDSILVVEEVLPFLEENLKILAQNKISEIGIRKFFGKSDGIIPKVGELNPDIVASALETILNIKKEERSEEYTQRASEIAFQGVPHRENTFCPGCPHRASFWSLHQALQLDNQNGFTCGDIGCYTLGLLPSGFSTIKTVHSMGSGTGLASGFGKLGKFGMNQPVVAVCGDGTFFHSGMPPLVNAVHQNSNMLMVILDNSGTAMTGFQPHPGVSAEPGKTEKNQIDIEKVCRSLGVTVETSDPFDPVTTQSTMLELLDKEGVNVLILKQKCALSPEKRNRNKYKVKINTDNCIGDACGCNRICTRIFSCPGLIWNPETNNSEVNEVLCSGCGMCSAVCPEGAISKEVL